MYQNYFIVTFVDVLYVLFKLKTRSLDSTLLAETANKCTVDGRLLVNININLDLFLI